MASSKRFVGGSRKGPVIDAEFREIPETSLARPVLPSPPVEARPLRPVAARARMAARATASADRSKCIACGSVDDVRPMKVGKLTVKLCNLHRNTVGFAAGIMRMFF